jgi:hypothetical protein
VAEGSVSYNMWKASFAVWKDSANSLKKCNKRYKI